MEFMDFEELSRASEKLNAELRGSLREKLDSYHYEKLMINGSVCMPDEGSPVSISYLFGDKYYNSASYEICRIVGVKPPPAKVAHMAQKTKCRLSLAECEKICGDAKAKWKLFRTSTFEKFYLSLTKNELAAFMKFIERED